MWTEFVDAFMGLGFTDVLSWIGDAGMLMIIGSCIYEIKIGAKNKWYRLVLIVILLFSCSNYIRLFH